MIEPNLSCSAGFDRFFAFKRLQRRYLQFFYFNVYLTIGTKRGTLLFSILQVVRYVSEFHFYHFTMKDTCHSNLMRLMTSAGLVMCVFSLALSQPEESSWTHFRGTQLDGISHNAGLPLKWNDSLNVIWKKPVHGKGHSSPVVFNGKIWLTTASGSGKELYALCYDFKTGRLIHDVLVFQRDSALSIHTLNSYATPTPAVADDAVYVHFGSMGTACLDPETGEVIWKRTDLVCDHVQGPASCPFIYRNLLILHYEGVDIQYIVALNRKTGQLIWKTIRPQEYYTGVDPIARKAYSTPILIHVDGRDMLISSGSEVCIAYDPMTGKEIWRITYTSDSSIAMPLYTDGVLLISTGFGSPVRLMAVNPKGNGNITQTNILWQTDKDVPGINTPVALNGRIYMIQEHGTVTCLNVKTGALIWKNKLKGEFYSSPVAADGKVYFPSKQGITYVLKEGNTFNLLAQNKTRGEIMATLAVSGKSLLLRTSSTLYRIQSAPVSETDLTKP